MKGNQFGASGVATPLSKQVDGNGNYIGYFQVELECYNENGELLATYVQTLADYRNGKNKILLPLGRTGQLIRQM